MVCCKEEATPLSSLSRGSLGCRDFGAKLDTATNDAIVVDICVDGRIHEVSSRIGLPGMCCEGASILRIVLRMRVTWELVVEVVIVGWVFSKFRIVVRGCEIDGRSCAP